MKTINCFDLVPKGGSIEVCGFRSCVTMKRISAWRAGQGLFSLSIFIFYRVLIRCLQIYCFEKE